MLDNSKKINVVFVCHGNICRSPMAEYIFKDLIRKENLSDCFYVTSMATSTEELGNGIYPNAEDQLVKHNIKGFESHYAKQIRLSDYDRFDYILVMDNMNQYNLKRIIGSDPNGKVHKLLDYTEQKGEIEDPWYTRNFDKVYNQIYSACKSFLEYLKAQA